jgi:hypothetical protein
MYLENQCAVAEPDPDCQGVRVRSSTQVPDRCLYTVAKVLGLQHNQVRCIQLPTSLYDPSCPCLTSCCCEALFELDRLVSLPWHVFTET